MTFLTGPPAWLNNGRLSNLEGMLDRNKMIGLAPMDSFVDNTQEWPLYEQLLAENQMLKQILYHRGTNTDERNFYIYRKISNFANTSWVARKLNDMSNGNKYNALPIQFLYRIVYELVDTIVGSDQTRWSDKPKNMSKLKWLWQNDQLLAVMLVVLTLECVMSYMHQLAPKEYRDCVAQMNSKISMIQKAKQKP